MIRIIPKNFCVTLILTRLTVSDETTLPNHLLQDIPLTFDFAV